MENNQSRCGNISRWNNCGNIHQQNYGRYTPLPTTKTSSAFKGKYKPFGQFSLYMEVIIFGGMLDQLPEYFISVLEIYRALRLSKMKKIYFIHSFVFLNMFSFRWYLHTLFYCQRHYRFFSTFGSSIIDNIIAVDEYFSFIISTMLAAGLVFELPMVSFFFKIGILKPEFMRKYRKHSIIIILLVAGILT